MKTNLTALMTLLVSISYAQVGINTETPVATLDVKSKNINETGKVLQISDSKNNSLFTVLSDGNINCGDKNTNTTSTLNVNGYVQLGTADKNIDEKSLQPGMIRFNSKTEKFQGYTKEGWVDLN